jgi:hypothetical protein
LLATTHNLWISKFLTSSTTSIINRRLAVPSFLFLSSFQSMILTGISLLPIIFRCPTHPNLAPVTVLTIHVASEIATAHDCALFSVSLHHILYIGFFYLKCTGVIQSDT